MDFGGEQGDRPYLSLLADALALSPCRVAPGEEAFALGAQVSGLPLSWPSGALEATLLARASARGAKVVLSGAFADACFDGDPEAVPIPPEHIAELDRRLADEKLHPDDSVSWEEVKRKLQRPK